MDSRHPRRTQEVRRIGMIARARRRAARQMCVRGPGRCPWCGPARRVRPCRRDSGIEDLRVLADPLLVDRLGDDQEITLEAPAQQHLRRRPARPPRDLLHRRMVRCRRSPASCTPRPGRPLTARVEQGPPVVHRAELHLVDDRRDRAAGSTAASSLVPKLEIPTERASPRSRDRSIPGQAQTGSPGAVDQIQVHLVDAEPPQALLGLGYRVVRPGWNLVVMNTSSRGTPPRAAPARRSPRYRRPGPCRYGDIPGPGPSARRSRRPPRRAPARRRGRGRASGARPRGPGHARPP